MVRTPCRDASNTRGGSAPAAGRGGSTPPAPKDATDPSSGRGGGGPELPPSLDGARSLDFTATKRAASPGHNGGSWLMKSTVRVGKKVIFNQQWSLVFALEDDVRARDAECLGQLRETLAEVWHRASCLSKETCALLNEETDGGQRPVARDFAGARVVKLAARKYKKGKKWTFECKALAATDFGTYARDTSCQYAAEADAARASAGALLEEIASTYVHATRTEAGAVPLALAPPRGDADAENGGRDPESTATAPPPGLGSRTLGFVRDVYGATSNVDAVLHRGGRA